MMPRGKKRLDRREAGRRCAMVRAAAAAMPTLGATALARELGIGRDTVYFYLKRNPKMVEPPRWQAQLMAACARLAVASTVGEVAAILRDGAAEIEREGAR